MTTHDNLAVAAGHSVDPSRWLGIFDDLMLRAGARFRRVAARRRARAFVLGLLAGLPRANCRSIAEHAGDATPPAALRPAGGAPTPAPGSAPHRRTPQQSTQNPATSAAA